MSYVSSSISASAPYFPLGDFHRPTPTQSSDAQIWFDRGLTWIYSFHHDEAVYCFEQCLRHDPTCVMAFWATAWALGPNHNVQFAGRTPEQVDAKMKKIHAALDAAAKLQATPLETSLLAALSHRFPRDWSSRDYQGWNIAYADAMHDVYADYSTDLDVACIYADALMCLAPWRQWDLRTGKALPGSRAPQAQTVLETALADPAAAFHPGLLHMYIHLMEMTPTPEKALTVADRVRGLVPSGAHLNHMPSHLDILMGDYRLAISANAQAILNDELYVSSRGAAPGYYIIYRLHDLQSLVYAAMFAGQYGLAIKYTDKLEQVMTPDLIEAMVGFAEGSFATRMHLYVRFGRWTEILATSIPADMDGYAIAMTHYAKGIAHASMGNVASAEAEQTLFNAAAAALPESRLVFPNKASDVLAIGREMLAGEILYRKADYTDAFAHLRRAVELYDGLVYAEPWGWMMPVRHALAALLLEQDHVDEALEVYAADLGFADTLPRACQHPWNVWALVGMHECLTRLGREKEAGMLEGELRIRKAVADVDIAGSCYCKRRSLVGEAIDVGRSKVEACCA